MYVTDDHEEVNVHRHHVRALELDGRICATHYDQQDRLRVFVQLCPVGLEDRVRQIDTLENNIT